MGSTTAALSQHTQILSGRHLFKTARGIASPFVEIDVWGVEQDRVKTKTVSDNGFRPTWFEEFNFEVAMPELAHLRLVVQDEDMFGDPNTIGQNVYPLGTKDEPSVRTGASGRVCGGRGGGRKGRQAGEKRAENRGGIMELCFKEPSLLLIAH